MFVTFVVFNIPTFVLAIKAHTCRADRNQSREATVLGTKEHGAVSYSVNKWLLGIQKACKGDSQLPFIKKPLWTNRIEDIADGR